MTETCTFVAQLGDLEIKKTFLTISKYKKNKLEEKYYLKYQNNIYNFHLYKIKN